MEVENIDTELPVEKKQLAPDHSCSLKDDAVKVEKITKSAIEKKKEEEKEGQQKKQWKPRQNLEPATSSSEEDIADTKEKVKRRKKRPKNNTGSEVAGRQKKVEQILDVLSSEPLDLEALRELAVSDGGLVKDELRRKAWPQLMMVEHVELAPKPLLEVVKSHKDYQQVVLDVQRSLKRFPPGIDDDYRVILMDQLTILIIRVLMTHPELHYYQGYHDVAITFLLVMGEDLGFELVERLSVTHLSEFMRPTMDRTTYYLTYLYPILHRANPTLYQFLLDSGVGTVFCLPWLITWFAHTLSDYRNVVRLYDFFLASPYLIPMYIAAAIVLQKKEDILAGECEMAMQHYILSQVPDSLPFEKILVEARRLHEEYPPDHLREEVEQYLRNKAEEESKEKQRLLERKKRYVARHRPYRKVIDALSLYIPRLVPVQRQNVFKFALFAASIFVARSIYTYYSTSRVELSSVSV